MRKRIACINEAPIAESERRIAVDQPQHNHWLSDQGLSGQDGQPAEFPLAAGHLPAY